jgi:hypothetical protein
MFALPVSLYPVYVGIISRIVIKTPIISALPKKESPWNLTLSSEG